MPVRAKYYRGNLLYLDGQSWYDAIGANAIKFVEHFVQTPFASADTLAGWTTTLVEAGGGETTVALTAGAAGGALLITTDANDNDGANLQVQGEAFKLLTYPLYFGCRFQISEATQSDFLVGLCITDTDLLGGMTDGIYFRKVDATATMNFVLEKDSTETATAYGTALVADTWYTVEFLFDGTNVDWYVNGVLQTRPAISNLPNDEFLTPSIHFLAGTTGGMTMSVDWIRAISILA
jgi:hypothetical protein